MRLVLVAEVKYNNKVNRVVRGVHSIVCPRVTCE